MKIIKPSVLLALAALAGCVGAPTRSDTKDFALKDHGQVAPEQARPLADCIFEGFDRAHSKVFTNVTVRQRLLADGIRVETLSGGYIILMSADIYNDGRAEIYESTAAGLINTMGERQAFTKCLKTTAITKE